MCGYKIVLHLASCLNHPDFRPASKILHLFTDILSFLLLFIPSLCEVCLFIQIMLFVELFC